MKQPKYKFGEKFSAELSTVLRGKRITTDVMHYVVAIQANCDSAGYVCYEYKVSSTIPVPYYIEGTFTSEWLTENTLERQYTYVTI